MKNLAESMRILAGQLDRLKEFPKAEELRSTINDFSGIMKEVVEFIEQWLESWLGAYPVMWDGLTIESLSQSNTSSLSLIRTKLLNYGRR